MSETPVLGLGLGLGSGQRWADLLGLLVNQPELQVQ